MEPFSYAELPSKTSFRVLRLLPGHLEDDDVHVELQDADWEKPPQYEAISYCWGSPDNTRSIICNGLRLQVSANLWHGLKRMRLVDKARLLWADAVWFVFTF
jgi:hypothetical protein